MVAPSGFRTASGENARRSSRDEGKADALAAAMAGEGVSLPDALVVVDRCARDGRLGDLADAIEAIGHLLGASDKIAPWLASAPPALEGETPFDLLETGRLDAFIEHIDRIRHGIYI